jgi:RHS repeat-associated protein
LLFSPGLGSSFYLLLLLNNEIPVKSMAARSLLSGFHVTAIAAPTQTVTDRDFTGQPQNRAVGLLYYQARFYVPSIGRFASADTIIPDPAQPQTFNRYTYVFNRPLGFTDPTGHRECNADGNCGPPVRLPKSTPPRPSTPMPTIANIPMVTFSGCETCTWSDEEMATVQASANLTGTKLAETLNGANGWNLTAGQAFIYTYGGSVNFHKTGTACASGCWGETFLRAGNVHEIEVYTDANLAGGDARWAVHELGHAFVNTGRGNPITMLDHYQATVAGFPNRPLTPNDPLGTWGFAGPRWDWQRSDQGRTSEEFADMYLGWVYNQWEPGDGGGWSDLGQMRADFMNSLMTTWLR